METIVILGYIVLGYWATGVTIYANKIRIGRWDDLLFNRIVVGVMLGWIIIPIALIKCLLMGKK